MRKQLVLIATIAALAVSASAFAQTDRKKQNGPVFNAPKGTVLAPVKAKPSSSPNTAPRPTGNAPLTSQECTRLGGTVHKSPVCNSGQSCQHTDQNKKTHEVCVSAK